MKDFSKAVNLFSLKDFEFQEVEGAAREGEDVDYEDIESAVSHLLN
jgi:hypothetical protein